MTWLLMKVSGVPMLERSLRKKRPGYDEYRQRVPAFLPRAPRRAQYASGQPTRAIARSRSAR